MKLRKETQPWCKTNRDVSLLRDPLPGLCPLHLASPLRRVTLVQPHNRLTESLPLIETLKSGMPRIASHSTP